MALNEHLVSEEWVKLKTTKFNFNIIGAMLSRKSPDGSLMKHKAHNNHIFFYLTSLFVILKFYDN